MKDNNDIRSMLEEAVARKKRQQQEADYKNLTSDLVKEIAGTIAPDDVSNAVIDRIEKSITPVLERLMEKDRVNASDITNAISQLEIKVPEISIPEFNFPEIKIPTPKVTVNVPKITIPEIKMPDEMSVKGWLSMMGYDKGLLSDPFPVQIRTADGKPVDFSQQSTVYGGGGGGKADFFTIKGFMQSAFAEIMNADGEVKVAGTFTAGAAASSYVIAGNAEGVAYNSNNPFPVTITSGASSTTATNIVDSSGIAYSGSNPVPVTMSATDLDIRNLANATDSVAAYQVSGAIWSTYVTGIFNSTTADVLNADNRIRVSVETGGSGLTDSELRATAVPVAQVSGASWSTEATQSGTWNIGTVTTVTGITNTVATALVDSSGVQYSTANPLPIDDAGGSITVDGTVGVSGVTASIQATLIDSSGVGYSGSNPVPITGTVVVSSITATTASNIVDSSGVGYSGSNPLPITVVSGALTSTISVGAVVSDAVDDGSAPIKTGGIARTANPTAVAGGDIISASYDDLGRQLVRPVQVRDLLATAYATLTNGTETTLLAGATGVFHDLVYLMGSNVSDVATTVDIRAVTAGNVIMSLRIPANGTAGLSLPLPIPQDATGNNWTADMGDITGTTVYVSGLFSKEV